MKNKYQIVLFIVTLCFLNLKLQGQISQGSEEIDKVKYDGAVLFTNYDHKFLEQHWKIKLASIGAQSQKKEAFLVENGSMPSVTFDKVNLISKAMKRKGDKSVLFVSIKQGNGEVIVPGHSNWASLESYLQSFSNELAYENGIRVAQNAENEAIEKQKKLIKTSQKINDDIAENKKEREKLQRKLEENAKELEKLNLSTESNKKDLTAAAAEIEAKKKDVEAARLKPKN